METEHSEMEWNVGEFKQPCFCLANCIIVIKQQQNYNPILFIANPLIDPIMLFNAQAFSHHYLKFPMIRFIHFVRPNIFDTRNIIFLLNPYKINRYCIECIAFHLLETIWTIKNEWINRNVKTTNVVFFDNDVDAE